MKKQRGFAALLIIFILGMVSILVASGLILTGYNESQMARSGASGTSAFYVANSGIEDAIYKLNADPNYTATVPFELDVSTGKAKYTVVLPASGNNKERIIDSIGTMGPYVNRIHAVVENTSVKPGFEYAVQGGTNGVEISNSKVEGDVFSNGYIKGNKASVQANACKTTGTDRAWITETATAVDTIGKLDTNDTGVCISGDAIASYLKECYVVGTRTSPNAVDSNCAGNVTPPVISPAPTPVPPPMSDADIQSVKNYLTHKGTTFSGSCTIDGTSHMTNCGGTSNTIGNSIITENLTVSSNNILKISGPVWVKGSITFNSNVSITITATTGQIVITDQPLTSSSNTAFDHNGNAYLLFISTYTAYPSPLPTPPPDPSSAFCDTPAITISSNTSNVLFFTPAGCALINSNATFVGSLVAEKVKIINNSTVTYDANLANAVFSTSQAGGWQIASFSQL